MISSGRLRHRVRIEEFANLLDSNGEAIQDPNTGEVARSWVEVKTVWAAIEPLSAREFIAAQATQSKVNTKIVMRKPPNIDAAMRLVHVVNGIDGTVYNIEGILPDKESGMEYITFPASSGVNESGR